ncbi:TonB system transport protein ExbD [Paracoccus pacificus]|uniref:Biopolymer transport protein ExbD n=1 Tax=Paracoccus pacificus TaxID=1463598 RepID=A0ABW4RBZ8_9RHOB
MGARIREQRGDDFDELAEINVTPFIDVMLVLLIIFMVAAPLATVDINVDLPNSNATPAPRPETPVYVTVRPDLSVALGNQVVPKDGLAQALQTATGGDTETRLYLRADQSVTYGDLMAVMNAMRNAGFTRIGLVGVEVPG